MTRAVLCDVCHRAVSAEEPDPEKYASGKNYAIRAAMDVVADLFSPANEEDGYPEEWNTETWGLDICATCLTKMIPGLDKIMREANEDLNGVVDA